jgi:hypothetical protein
MHLPGHTQINVSDVVNKDFPRLIFPRTLFANQSGVFDKFNTMSAHRTKEQL